MLGDTATVSSSVNPGGGGGGAATNSHHHHQQHQHNLHQQQQHQSHHSPNPAAIGGGGLFQEGISTSEAGGGGAGHVGSSSGGEEDRLGGGGSGSFGGNRWPRQETVALLKIRTDMDATFRDASVKGPLWDEVSRKLAELGYHRSAKKCKEKFENVYKYHKRTKDVRTSKQEGKNYRFFEQLAAFESQPPAGATPNPPPPHPQPSQPIATTMSAFNPTPPKQAQPAAFVTMAHHITTVPSTTVSPPVVAPPITITAPSYPPAPQPTIQPLYPPPFSAFSTDLMSNSPSSSSSTSSDVELHRGGRHKRKRKWKDFFGRLMTEVVHKQEEMQRKFLEAIEKREHERMAREESWRMQEMARINREREILAQERSIAAAKDAAVMSFLQKLSDQQNPGAPPLHLANQAVQIAPNPPPPTQQPPPQQPPPAPSVVAALPQPPPQSTPNQVQSAPPPAAATPTPVQQPQLKHPVSQSQSQGQNQKEMVRADNVDQNFLPASSSRWPKVEVEALISLRRNLDSKYQENGPKGPLWEEISAGMKRLGYNRNPKRCKEKWENINKYFKKVKESNKKRPEDSKTCPYFHQLDALYREKQNLEGGGSSSAAAGGGGVGGQFNSVPLMVQPEQQWPPQALPPPPVPPPPPQQQKDTVMEEGESEDHGDDEEEDDYDDEEDDDVAGEYELVSNKPHSMNPGG